MKDGTERGGGFPCPECGERTIVIDSRPSPAKRATRRIRKCQVCRVKFRTYEMTAAALTADPLDVKIRAGVDELAALLKTYLDREEWDEI